MASIFFQMASPFSSGKERPKISKDSLKKSLKVYSFIKPYQFSFYLGLLFLVLSSLTVLILPMLLPRLADTAQGIPVQLFKINGKYLIDCKTSWDIVKVTMLFIVLQGVFSFFRIYIFAQTNERVLKDIRSSVYNKIITSPIIFFENNRVGELISRISSDITNVQDALSLNIAEFLRQVVTLLAGIVYVFISSKELTFFILCTIPVLVLLALFFSRYIRNNASRTQQALAQSNIIVDETFHNISVVKAYVNEYFESNRYVKSITAVKDLALRAALFRGAFISFLIVGVMTVLIMVLYKASIYVHNFYLHVEPSMSVGQLLSFIFFTVFIGGSLAGMGDLYGKIISALGSSDRIVSILDMPSETKIEQVPLQKINGEIEFNKVNFSYPSRKETGVLHDISMHIRNGEKVALVGSSGAGKSTILQLLLRFYPVNSGDIKVAGKDIYAYDVQELRSNIALVPQEVMLFGGTIRENIAYGKTNATDEEIKQATIKANAYDFIRKFPDGFDTIVGERGVKLSGGQRQRIAIARAILKDPAILLLDEATSALDAESEKLVQDALNKLMENRTTIVIAHRLSTIRTVDKIFVMNHGVIVEEGTHDELSSKENGLYSNLLKLQYQIE